MKLPKPDPTDALHRQRASRWRKKRDQLQQPELAWLDAYDAACTPRRKTAREAFPPPAAPPANLEAVSTSMSFDATTVIPEKPLEVKAAPPPEAAPPAPAPAPALEGGAVELAPAAAAGDVPTTALTPEVLAARAAALKMVYGMAADGFEELHEKIEATMQRQWILPRAYWREAWLPLIVEVTNRYLPDWVSGPLIDGVAVGAPPVALIRAARRLEKAGYRLGEPGEAGRAVATAATTSPAAPATERRTPTPPAPTPARVDPAAMFGKGRAA